MWFRILVGSIRSSLRKPALFAVALTLFCAWPHDAGGAPIEKDSNGLLGVNGVLEGSPYLALRCGASVYRCTIVGWRIVSPPGVAVQYGSVTVTISETYFGDAAKQITLPFSRANLGHAMIRDTAIWPDPAYVKPETELCAIVVPHSYDRTADLVPGVDSAATEVFVAKESAAKDFAFVRRICEIEKLKAAGKGEKFRKELQDALRDKDQRVRYYAIDALYGDFVESDPDHVFADLRDAMEHRKEIGLKSSDIGSMSTAMTRALLNERFTVKTRAAALRSLFLLGTETGDKDMQSSAIGSLGFAVTRESFRTPNMDVYRNPASRPLPFKRADVFSPEEIKKLRTVADEVGKDGNLTIFANFVRKWLDEGK